jgi:hypothetical protein
MCCSNVEIAFLNHHQELFIIKFIDSLSIVTFSLCAIKFNLFSMSEFEILLKSYLWQRDMIVSGTLCVSVVARMNFTCLGGSSSILSNALNAHLLNMCTSSIIYTLYLVFVGENCAFSIKSLILSTQV